MSIRHSRSLDNLCPACFNPQNPGITTPLHSRHHFVGAGPRACPSSSRYPVTHQGRHGDLPLRMIRSKRRLFLLSGDGSRVAGEAVLLAVAAENVTFTM